MSERDRRWLDWSRAFYRALLSVYPVEYRDRFGPDVLEAFLDRCRNALDRRGLPGLGVQWLRGGVDALAHAVSEWVAAAKVARRRRVEERRRIRLDGRGSGSGMDELIQDVRFALRLGNFREAGYL